jgi:hypothetical protein
MNAKINKDLDTVGEIIIMASYNISCLEFMIEDPNNEKKKIIQKFIFIRVALNALWNTAVLDLNKLLSSSGNDKFRLTSLINRLINNYKNIKWERSKSKEELQELLLRLGSYNEEIKKIIDLRDKQIAHRDFLERPLYLSIKDLKPLLVLCQEIFNDLSLALTGGTTHWGLSESEKIQPVVISLLKYQSLKELAFQNLSNQNKMISTQDIMNIIRANS